MKSRLAILIGVLVVAAVGCGDGTTDPSTGTSSTAGDGPTVYLRNLAYEPSELTIAAGDTVTWIWDDGDIEHDVVGDGFETELLTTGTFSHSFDEPGDYPYLCTIHPTMTGTVTVTP